MCRSVTPLLLVVLSAAPVLLNAQNPSTAANPAAGWRRVGNTVVDLGLASPAGGGVDRVWFSPDGQTIYARLPNGRMWQTTDLERWTAAERVEAPETVPSEGTLPEPRALTASSGLQRSRVYAAASDLWRSDDGGRTWANATGFEGRSILGGRLADVAVSPVNPEEVVVAGANGIWRSVDGGASWTGMNEGLPNLPANRLVAVPGDVPVVRVAADSGAEYTWSAGERAGWRVPSDSALAREAALRLESTRALGIEVSASVRTQDQWYAGTVDGRLFTSADRGRTWRQYAVQGAGRIQRIFIDARDPLFAVTVTGSRQRARVLRTSNGGTLWDDITGNLPTADVLGVAADRPTGAVYVATSAGVFMAYPDTAAPSTQWTRIREGAALDVMVDAEGNQLYVLGEGTGVFATLAPHRTRDPKVVSAGDRILRAAAPGSLLSVIGARVESARAGDTPAPVLDAGVAESQVQLPFDLTGSGVVVSMNSPTGRLQIGLPLSQTSPAIFVDRDGNPLLLNGETGLILDAATPARSNARLQVLASGLGRVTPNWPAGLAAPLEEPPRVVAPVRAYLDREPLEVTRATLAPGYVGLYLVEVRLPSIVNRGTAELYIEAGEGTSNRVRLYIEP